MQSRGKGVQRRGKVGYGAEDVYFGATVVVFLFSMANTYSASPFLGVKLDSLRIHVMENVIIAYMHTFANKEKKKARMFLIREKVIVQRTISIHAKEIVFIHVMQTSKNVIQIPIVRTHVSMVHKS